MGKIYKTAMGKRVDMEALVAKNEKEVAIGNMGINAKGDRLGKGGEIVETSNERVKEYYNNPKAVKKSVSVKGKEETAVEGLDKKQEKSNEKPATKAKTKAKATATQESKKTTEKELPDGSIEIVEADDQDFEGEE